MSREDLEQAAYLRGWNDRPTAELWTGIIIGVVVGLIIGWVVF